MALALSTFLGVSAATRADDDSAPASDATARPLATDFCSQDRVSVDFGSQYRITHAFNLYFNAKNLTNTPLKFTAGRGEKRVIQREFYGATPQAGFNYRW